MDVFSRGEMRSRVNGGAHFLGMLFCEGVLAKDVQVCKEDKVE